MIRTQQPPALIQGKLDLAFEATSSGKTIMRVCDQRPPLRVIRAFEQPDGTALVHLHNVSGGVLGGDTLELSATLGPNACVQLTTTGATRLYRNHADRPGSVQRNHLRIGEGALLELLPDPIIPYAGASHHQATTVELAHDAGLFWWEVVTPGREARGERFAYQSLSLSAEITTQDRPILLDQVHFQPDQRAPQSLARLGSYGYYATLVICQVGLPAAMWNQYETELAATATSMTEVGHTIWGVSTLAAHGLIIRALSVEGHTLISGLVRLWKAAKRMLYGREAIPPRKIY